LRHLASGIDLDPTSSFAVLSNIVEARPGYKAAFGGIREALKICRELGRE